MSENGQGDSTANDFEDSEMKAYKKSALNVVTFVIVRDESDVENRPTRSNSFHPDMAHQVFGDSELVFGYRHISINIHYLHNSAKCYLNVEATGRIPETDECEPDDIMKALKPWIPESHRLEKSQFLKDLKDENHSLMFGQVIDTFMGEKDNRKYMLTICDIKEEAFRDFHERFETLIVWFIDGANFIDLNDERWMIFYIYEETNEDGSDLVYRSPIGFCTVYKFYLYPNSTRPRISQFFVLPTHQRKGIATSVYSKVISYLRDLPEVSDITVEEPTEVFQKIRDYCDSLTIYKSLNDRVLISTQNQKQINDILKQHKLCKRQAQRVFDILECLTTHKNGYNEYLKFTQSIKARITSDIERETRGSKRICNLERAGVFTEPIDKKASIDAEYNRYIDSLEWPVNRLRTVLSKS